MVAPYYVLDYPDWTALVAIDADGRVLHVEQYRHGLGGLSLELPGGVVDGAEDVLAAARRELREETGHVGGEATRIASLSPDPAKLSNRCEVVLIRGVLPGATPADDPTERVRLRFVTAAEARRMMRDGSILHGVHVAALTLALEAAGL
jgi:8-oxo-dGTP pyrophosphatase MutT (NUDIX family)